MRSFFRFIVISKILIKYRLDSLILSTPILKSFKPLLYLVPWFYFPTKKYSRGQRIRLSLEELGPIFIKFGQTLSTRRDLLPNDISDELAKLQDKCPAFSSDEAQKIIEKALGNEIKNLFASFDKAPLASASIAQVHSATTKNNEDVIIKVVRPNISRQIKRDIGLLYALANLLAKHPDGRRLRPKDAVTEFENIIFSELNMITEAANASLLRKNFKGSDKLYIPKVYWELCRSNVFVAERIYATPVSDIKTLKAKNTDFKKLAEDGVKVFFTQVFKHNFFHADMHPGNIFVSEKGNYIGVDFGIMGTLSKVDQNFIAQIFLAFFNQDYKRVAQVYVESGWVPPNTNILAFEGAIRSISEPMFAKPLGEISFGQVLLNLLKEARNFDITIQPQLLLLDKTLLNIEGLGRMLYPELDLWATAKPFLEELMREKHSLKNSFEKLIKKTPEIARDIPELPSLVFNALKQLENGELQKSTQQQKTSAITQQLKINAKKSNALILASALIILAGIFAVNELWLATSTAGFFGLIFLLKSR